MGSTISTCRRCALAIPTNARGALRWEANCEICARLANAKVLEAPLELLQNAEIGAATLIHLNIAS
jgi:hypothetical protein